MRDEFRGDIASQVWRLSTGFASAGAFETVAIISPWKDATRVSLFARKNTILLLSNYSHVSRKPFASYSSMRGGSGISKSSADGPSTLAMSWVVSKTFSMS